MFSVSPFTPTTVSLHGPDAFRPPRPFARPMPQNCRPYRPPVRVSRRVDGGCGATRGTARACACCPASPRRPRSRLTVRAPLVAVRFRCFLRRCTAARMLVALPRSRSSLPVPALHVVVSSRCLTHITLFMHVHDWKNPVCVRETHQNRRE
ncbi:hypothetical protein BC628DRAFT_901099 [Trametes gibbosa]|nr:hypothetical protein BC628DRAFT_901099 [Trametes gibbosa]